MGIVEHSAQKHRKGLIFAGLASLAALVVLSFQEYEIKQMFHTQGRLHEWGHFGAFALTEALLALGFRSWLMRWRWAIAMVGIGCGVEALQHLLFLAPLEIIDMLIDALGVVLGLASVLLWEHHFGLKSSHELRRP